MLSEGQLAGHIRIVARLGTGGMGEVWEGLDERLGRRVAVKTIRRAEVDPVAARARAAREARILSRLEHPNVCRLYEYIELGEYDLLVLELVRGRTLRSAIATGLRPAQRLEVALGCCSALVAAHALSIVHRDLKPENVMLVEDGSVKVLDFGIARRVLAQDDASAQPPTPVREAEERPVETRVADLQDDDETGAAFGVQPELAETVDSLTAAGQVLGTPRYMSPEQARGEPATAASDMYSFGLLLYELYTGKPPYEATSSPKALVRAQWGDVPAARGIDRKIAALIAELTNLDPRQRPSAEQALERLRFVQGRPLRRLRAAAVAVTSAGLVIGTGLSLLGLARARREAAAAKATTDFLVQLFQGSDPQKAPNPEIKARQILDQGASRLRSELKDQPVTRGRLLTTLGGIYGNLGLNKEARALLEEALTLQESQFGRDDPALLPVLRYLANTCAAQAQHGRGDQLFRRAVAIAARAKRPADEAEALELLAASLEARGRLDEAETAARRALSLREANPGPNRRKTAALRANLALIEIDRGHYQEAGSMLESALVVIERELGPEHYEVAAVLGNLATVRKELGRLDEAEALYRRALAVTGKHLGPEHTQCATIHNDLAIVLAARRKYAEAEAHYRRAVTLAEAGLGAEHPVTAIFRGNLGEVCLLQGRAAEAEPLYRSALRALRAAYGEQHAWVAETLRGLGRVCAELGRDAEAESLLVESARVREAVDGPRHPELGKVLTQLGRFYAARGQRELAAQTLERARTILEPAYEAGHPALVELHEALAASAGASGSARSR